jgi:hypothetical protein
MDIRADVTDDELAELRWHVGQGPRPERLPSGVDSSVLFSSPTAAGTASAGRARHARVRRPTNAAPNASVTAAARLLPGVSPGGFAVGDVRTCGARVVGRCRRTYPLGNPADPDCEWETEEPSPAFAQRGAAIRVGGVLVAELVERGSRRAGR